MPNRNGLTKVGIVIMTYGSATTPENVAAYLQHIYKEGKVPEGLVENFARRYRLIGRSPLIDITKQQAALLESELNKENSGFQYVARAGMLHSHPYIDEAFREISEQRASEIVGIILSPQFSSFIMAGYQSALMDAAKRQDDKDHVVHIADPWPAEEHFIKLLSKSTATALAELRTKYARNVPVIFTTHSLPERVVAKDPYYLEQLRITTEAVVAELHDPELEWYSAYQSAGHTPEPWLKPDLVDILADLRNKHDKAVLIVPVQFLTDHLEVLYDLDIAGKNQCEEYGISYNRIELPNTDPQFIKALASVTHQTLLRSQ